MSLTAKSADRTVVEPQASAEPDGLTLSRLYYILRYHRKLQLVRRLWKTVKAPIDARWPRRRSTVAPKSRNANCPPNRYASHDYGMSLGDLAEGRIRLLNLEADLGEKLDWDATAFPDAPPLWKFHLHYHEYLAALAPDPQDEDGWETIWNIVASWIEAHPCAVKRNYSLAWHPYCISRRIPVWTWLYRRNPPKGKLDEAVRASLAQQVRYLIRHKETDIGGNHYWENLKAILTACYFFENSDLRCWRLISTTLSFYIALSRQVSACGEHFEKSPAYQADLFYGLIDVANWEQTTFDVPKYRDFCSESAMPRQISQLQKDDKTHPMEERAERMRNFLGAICHPDGVLPLFGDSVETRWTPDRRNLETHQRSGSRFGWTGSYFVYETKNKHKLIFDAGNIGPDYLPAHSHSDLLGFEASIYGKRAFVDSGVFSYTGPKRNDYRGSSAHNVLTVDDVELADVWSSFRIGRRGHVKSAGYEYTDDGIWACATHDAYRRLGIPIVVRVWYFAHDGPWFSFHVVCYSEQTGVDCSNILTERIHLHPQIKPTMDDRSVRLRGLPGPAVIEPIHADTFEIQPSVYSPDFYIENESSMLTLSSPTTKTLAMGWSLSFGRPIKPRIYLTREWFGVSWTENGRERKAEFEPKLKIRPRS